MGRSGKSHDPRHKESGAALCAAFLSPDHRRWGMVVGMSASDPMLARIAAKFDDLDVQAARGGYILAERRTAKPVARLKPFPKIDRFELFYWSLVSGHWKSFAPLGPMKLTLDEAHEIVHAEPLFRFKRKSWIASFFR